MRKQLYGFFISVLWLICMAYAQAAPPSLPPFKQVFSSQVQVLDANHLSIRWKISEGYFLLAHQFRIQSNSESVSFGRLELPAAETRRDDFFGEFAVYSNVVDIKVPLQGAIENNQELNFTVFLQGCLNIENCYPRQAETFNINLSDALADLASIQNNAAQTTVKQTDTTPAASQYAEEEEFLDPEVAFAFTSQLAEDGKSLRATWKIADGYYLYRDKFNFVAEQNPQALGTVQFPQGKIKQDEFFGEIEAYYGTLTIDVPLQNLQELEDISVKFSYQGCAEAGLCYPPQHKSHTVSLAQAPLPDAGLDKLLKTSRSPLEDFINPNEPADGFGSPDEFLDPDIAFKFSAEMDGSETLIAHWQIAEGYYLYRHKFEFALAQGTLGEAQLSKGKEKQDEYFGRIEAYYYQAVARLPVSNIEGLDSLQLTVKYQGCADEKLCYPPMQKTVIVPITQGAASSAIIQAAENLSLTPQDTAQNLSEQDMIAQSLAGGNLFWILLSFFGFGLLLSLTPCVFPMIPILSSIIVGQGEHLTTRRAFIMSLVYVLAMAFTYALAGALAGVLGENIQAVFQNPWVLWTFALVFVALALSMFGFYDLQLPSSLQSKLSQLSHKQQGGTLIGVAIMGFLSALIVGPCVAAPLAGALIYISQTGDALLGFMALFAMSLGMGIPLLVIGTSAGKILPRAGGWMDTVKYVFGVMLLAVGVWMLDRVIPAQATLILAALLLIVPAIYMGALETLSEAASGWRKFWKGMAVAMLVYGIILIIGAASGGSSLMQPLKGLSLGGAGGGTAQQETLAFEKVKGIGGLEQALAKAKAAGQPVMLDFYADWCVSCIEMEHYTFSDKRVQQALANTLVLQTDVTKNDEQDKALLKHFNLFGPPAIIFYSAQGEELRNKRLVGFKPADEFLTHLNSL